MAETAISVDDVLGPYVAESATQMTTLTQTAGDASNGNVIDMAGRDVILLFDNTDAGSQTITIASSNDPYGRTATITAFAIGAGVRMMRKFSPLGWEENTGDSRLIVTVSDAGVLITAMRV